MIEPVDVERSAMRFEPAPGAFERLILRKRQKERRQRVAAMALGLGIVLGGFLVGASIFRAADPIRDPFVTQPPGPTGEPRLEDTAFAVEIDGDARPLPRSIQELEPQQVRVSADGTRIAFEGGQLGRVGLFVAGIHGGSIRLVVPYEFPGVDLGGWSPDGTHLVYSGPGSSATSAIFVVDITTGATTQLLADPGYLLTPSFHPNGRSILFTWATRQSNTGWRVDLWTIPATGGVPTRLIDYGAYGGYSPDGTQIAYRRTRPQPDAYCGDCWWVDAGNSIVASDGSEQLGRTGGGHMSPMSVFDDVQPQWSPDGSTILFANPSNRIADFWIREPGTSEKSVIGSGSSATWLDDDTLILTNYSRS
jgi:Tol biopolymer transport system component